jgi:peptidoglycan hydrolase-like protein with peptidoglycan-binding domain
MAEYKLGQRTLKQGMKGSDVLELQRGLTTLGFDVTYKDKKGVKQNGLDGDYGSVTAAAVLMFQTMHKIKGSGVFDAYTHSLFVVALAEKLAADLTPPTTPTPPVVTPPAPVDTTQHFFPMRFPIPDFSVYQGEIDYDKFCEGNAFGIMRARVSGKTDSMVVKHMKAFKARCFPILVYDFIKLTSHDDAKKQAEAIHALCSPYTPVVWYVDFETLADGVSYSQAIAYTRTYISRLRELGAVKVGLYTGDYRWRSNLYKLGDAVDDVWIASYGVNSGYLSRMPSKIVGGLHQYTSMAGARIDGVKVKGAPGIDKRTDMNRLTGQKPLSWYTGRQYDTPDYYGVAKITAAVAAVLPDAGETTNKLGEVKKGALLPHRAGDKNGFTAVWWKDTAAFVPTSAVTIING